MTRPRPISSPDITGESWGAGMVMALPVFRNLPLRAAFAANSAFSILWHFSIVLEKDGRLTLTLHSWGLRGVEGLE
jgi:hypothetical protein